MSAVTVDEFELGETLTLSNPEHQADVPSVRWVSDRFSVVWPISRGPADWRSTTGTWTTALRVAHVFPAGQVTHATLELTVPAIPRLVSNRSGLISVTAHDSWAPQTGGCAMQLVDPLELQTVPSFTSACPGREVVPAPAAGGDWLIASATDVNNESSPTTPVSLLLSRFSPVLGQPVAEPQVVASNIAYDMVDLGVVHDDAWLVWSSSGRARLRQIKGASIAPSVSEDALGPIHTRGIAAEGSEFTMESVSNGEGLMAFTAAGSLHTLELHPDGTIGDLHTLLRTRVSDRAVGMTAMPELGAVGLCHATGPGLAGGTDPDALLDGVGLALVSESGRLLKQIQIADNIANIGGCDLAWSGRELLIAWWDIDLHGTANPRPEHSLLRAVVLPLAAEDLSP